MTGERLGRYRVTGVVGAGGFATVLRAVDDRLDDEVALKVLAENHSLDPDVRARFLAEGRVLRRIDSPHVVRVLDIGETERQQPYLVLELADRGDLGARVAELRREGWQPSSADVLALVRPLTEALEAVHRADLVHRDLSPGNLLLRSTLAPDPGAGAAALLRDDERLVLADLGLSKDLARSSGLTVAGGTEGFRPPEQRGGPSAVDARADLWSLSALVVWLLADEPPRDDRHARALLRDVDLPPEAVDALVTSLATDPSRRHTDVATWRHAVRLGLRSPDAPTVPPPGAAGPVAGRRLGRVGTVVAAALVGLLLGVLGPRLLPDGGGSSVTLDDGSVEVTASDGELEIVLRGPAEVTVGTSAVFRAEVVGATGFAWFAPDGAVHAGATSLTVTPSGPGGATVHLVATASGGREVRASHRLRVVDP